MAAIRDFFKNKKSKFKGQGHKLTGDGAQCPPRPSGPSAAPMHRQNPSEGAQRAGAAALARLEQQQAKLNPNWSLAAIRAQARKELELEQQQQQNETQAAERPPEVRETEQMWDLLFHCPLLGPEVRLPRKEIQARIRQFLYDKLEEEPGLTACLLIHTCNSPREKVQTGVDVLCKYLNNIVDHPNEDKYRRIKLTNRVFEERVLPLEGAQELLQAAGFEKVDEEFLVFPPDGDVEQLALLGDALRSAEPVRPLLDRDLKVLLPAQASVQPQLPDHFFCLSPQELKREQEAR